MTWLTPDIIELLARGLAITLLLTAVTSVTSVLVGVLTGLSHEGEPGR